MHRHLHTDGGEQPAGRGPNAARPTGYQSDLAGKVWVFGMFSAMTILPVRAGNLRQWLSSMVLQVQVVRHPPKVRSGGGDSFSSLTCKVRASHLSGSLCTNECMVRDRRPVVMVVVGSACQISLEPTKARPASVFAAGGERCHNLAFATSPSLAMRPRHHGEGFRLLPCERHRRHLARKKLACSSSFLLLLYSTFWAGYKSLITLTTTAIRTVLYANEKTVCTRTAPRAALLVTCTSEVTKLVPIAKAK